MGDFNRDEVLYYIISKGYRVRNHELVTHFKNFLDHPNNKARNRILFKDYVNELASVKLDAGGEKVLVLKKKFRPASSDIFGSSASIASSASAGSISGISSQSSLSSTTTSESSQPTPSKPLRDEPPQSDQFSSETNTGHNDPSRAKSEPPPATSSPAERDTGIDSPDGGGMSKIHSEEHMHSYRKKDVQAPGQVGLMGTGSAASLASNDSQLSTASSTSGPASAEDEANASVISVRDKIKKLNKIDSEISLSACQPRNVGGAGGSKKSYKAQSGDDDDASHSSGASYITLDPEMREWMITCSGTEYHEMNRLLIKNPGLAKLKDLTNGYTALHWAAKSGKAEVIKLIAGKPGVDVDQRSYGGYTPLHLAAIHGHEHIIELLVSVFKADSNLRDYSGRKAKQYLKNSASSKAQQLLMSRRLGPDQAYGKSSLDDSFIRNASARMSSRAKTMTSLMQVTSSVARQPLLRTSWAGSSDDIDEEKDGRRATPPRSGTPSPKPRRRKFSQQPQVGSKDLELMPPPSNLKLGSRRQHIWDRSQSSSRESLTSSTSKNSLQNDENQNMMRSGSDPSLKQGTIV